MILFRNAVSLGAVLAMLGAPLAMAQQYQQQQDHNAPAMQHESNTQHESMQHESNMQHNAPAHAQEHAQWHKGGHYTGHRTVVNNWRDHHLHQPPHGYEWVQDGNQFVLIAITTGVISSIIANELSQ